MTNSMISSRILDYIGLFHDHSIMEVSALSKWQEKI